MDALELLVALTLVQVLFYCANSLVKMMLPSFMQLPIHLPSIALHVRELCQADSWQGELPPLHSHGRAGDTGTDELLTRRAQAGDVARAIGV